MLHQHAALAGILLAFSAAAQESSTLQLSGPVVRGPLGEQLDDWLERAEAFGLHAAVLVEHDGEVILCKGYGLADRGSGRGITWRTRFDIGSLAKQFTAAAVAEQVRVGRFDWQTPLRELLDDAPEDKAGITVHQLLTHTAGLAYQPGPGSALDQPLRSPPGERHAYSNVGYALLARIVEAHAGASLDEVVSSLFERAGLDRARATGRPMDWDDQAHGYVDDYDFGPPEQLRYDEAMRGAGGYACTVAELYQWVRALEDGRVFDADIVEPMWADHIDGPAGYGYGWFVLPTTRGTPLVRHMGTYNGFNTELRRYREEDRTIVFLSNAFEGGRGQRDAVVNRIALQLVGAEVPEPPRVLPWSESAASVCLGRYRAADAEFDVAVADDSLRVTAFDQSGWDALYGVTGDDRASELVAQCAERSRQLVDALRRDSRESVEALTNPAWVRAYSDLASSWRRVVRRSGDVESVAVLGTAVRDAVVGTAVTIVEVTGAAGQGRLEVVWTRRGALGSGANGLLPGRRMQRVGDGRYAAFDLFSGVAVECAFGSAAGESAPWLMLRSGDAGLRAERV